MAVQRDYNKPLTEEEPYLVQVLPINHTCLDFLE